jgi:hypothetical protein
MPIASTIATTDHALKRLGGIGIAVALSVKAKAPQLVRAMRFFHLAHQV